MVLAIARWKIHPFIAIIATALVLAVVLGVPLKTVPDVIGRGFSSIFTGIGLVIIFGTIIGTINRLGPISFQGIMVGHRTGIPM